MPRDGSPSYIAPERARGGQASAAADLWALGASLYAAVEGRPPFDRDGVLASLTAVVADEPDPPRHAGPLWPVISGLLRKDPEARLNAAEAGQLLSRIAEKYADVPAEPTPGQQGSSWLEGPSQAVSSAADSTTTVESDQAMAHQEATTSGSAAVPEPAVPEAAVAEPAAVEPAVAAGASSAAEPGADQGPDLPAPRARSGGRRFRSVYAAAAVLVVVMITGVALVLARSPGRQLAQHPAAKTPATASTPTAAPSPASSSSATPGSSGSSALPAGYYARHAYALYWSTPMSDWTAYYHYFQAFAAAFRPASVDQAG